MPEPSNADILAKLIQHDAALAAADSERAHLSARLDALGQTVDSHSDMLRDLREALIGHGAELAGIHGSLADINGSIGGINGSIGEIQGNLASLNERVNRNSETLDAHSVTLDAHSVMLADHGRRLTSHGDLLATILATVTRIEVRLAEQ